MTTSHRMENNNWNYSEKLKTLKSKKYNWNKNSLEGLNSIYEPVEEKISKFKDRSTEIIQAKGQTDQRMKESEARLRRMWDTVKHTDIDVMGSTRRREKLTAGKNFLKVFWSQRLPKFIEKNNVYLQEVQWIPNRIKHRDPQTDTLL